MRCAYITVACIALAVMAADTVSPPCKLIPFETTDGRTGKYCIIWDHPEQSSTSDLSYLPPLKEATFVTTSTSTESEPESSTTAGKKDKTNLHKILIDTPVKCLEGQVIDVNGDCIDAF